MSNLSYGEPPRTSSGLLFHGSASPIPIPVPAPASPIPGTSSRLPSLSEGSSDKENSTPGTQQSVVMELVAIVEEEHLDISGESGHMTARRVQEELVRSVLGQCCRYKCHELAFFTFFSLLFHCINTCRYSPKSSSKTNLHSLIIHFAF